MNTPNESQNRNDEALADQGTGGDGAGQGGQVSETSGMDPKEKDTPIAPEDATAGYPDSESGHPDEGAAGPETSPPENHRDRQV